ncbi:MAG: acylphosphatase [Geobacteraceae bacterium]|jgi:acylphosphatase
MKIRAMVTIKGLVQGVNFRHYTQQTALQHDVTGWVRNLPDGNVAGCFEGEERDVRALIDWCRRGPAWARVDEVLVENEPYRGEFASFNVKF